MSCLASSGLFLLLYLGLGPSLTIVEGIQLRCGGWYPLHRPQCVRNGGDGGWLIPATTIVGRSAPRPGHRRVVVNASCQRLRWKKTVGSRSLVAGLPTTSRRYNVRYPSAGIIHSLQPKPASGRFIPTATCYLLEGLVDRLTSVVGGRASPNTTVASWA